jgi:hypothetical protein
LSSRDEVEAGQDDARSQQHAEEDQKRRLPGRNALANGPPKAAEEDSTERNARQ